MPWSTERSTQSATTASSTRRHRAPESEQRRFGQLSHAFPTGSPMIIPDIGQGLEGSTRPGRGSGQNGSDIEGLASARTALFGPSATGERGTTSSATRWHRVEIGRCQGLGLCSICVRGTELGEPCTREVLGRLTGATALVQARLSEDLPPPHST